MSNREKIDAVSSSGGDIISRAQNDARFYILMAPYHANMGDQAILIAEIKYLKDKFGGKKVQYLTTEDIPSPAYALKSVIRENDIIFLHGGGNMGTIWYNDERVRLDIVRSFPNNKIISFPQSAYYSPDEKGKRILEVSSMVYNSHKNLHLLARENTSYEFMKNNFPGANVYLVPDMAFYLDTPKSEAKRRGILFCMRNDRERALSAKQASSLRALAQSKSDHVRFLDTVFQPKDLDGQNMSLFLQGLLNEYKKQRLIVTDRLHGMVFAALSGTPCLVLSNSYHKVLGLYQWIKDLGYIKFAEPGDDLETVVDELLALESAEFSNAGFIDRFDIIRDIIDKPLNTHVAPVYDSDNPAAKRISDFLSSSAQDIEGLDELSFQSAKALYSGLLEHANLASENILLIDPELRVKLCDILDNVLERIVDLLPDDYLLDIENKPAGLYAPTLSSTADSDKPLLVNSYLLKEFGVSVYLMAKHFGGRPVMYYGAKNGEYPFLPLMPGMELLTVNPKPILAKDRRKGILKYENLFDTRTYLSITRSSFMDAYFKHLRSDYERMDALIFYGLYPQTLEYLNEYRRLRPDGKVYCGLDMNSYWMNAIIPWYSDTVARFASQCDVIATSAKTMRDALNRRTDVPFPCRWFTNGFYNPTGANVIADAKYKENIILTVGRIGTDQKNNEELLNAFAHIADNLPGWKLRLVGTIDPCIEEFIEKYFRAFPHLKERVVFTGPIYDKQQLYDEYARAKLFVLTSKLEGFPNVYAEALAHGCKFVTSDIDAAKDITNDGELGEVYKSGDLKALGQALLKVCMRTSEANMNEHIEKTQRYFERYYDWNRNIKKLAWMMYGMDSR